MSRRVRLPVIVDETAHERACPPMPCVLACKFSLLYSLNRTGSVVINDGPTVPRHRSREHVVNDADLEAAADAVVRRARELHDTCMWLHIRPEGLSQKAVGKRLGYTRARVQQIEERALHKAKAALRTETRGELEPRDWLTRKAA